MIELKGPDAYEWSEHRCTRQLKAELLGDLDKALIALLSVCRASTDPRVTAATMLYEYTKSMLKVMEPNPGGDDDSD